MISGTAVIGTRCCLHPELESPIGALDPWTLAQLAGVTLVAAVLQGTVGFGFTALAVTFYLMIMGSGDAVPLLIIVNLTISLVLVSSLWRDVNRALWVRMVAGALLGLPAGLLVFSRADVGQLKVFAAIVILGFVVVSVFLKPRAQGASTSGTGFRTSSVLGVGAVAGAMTSALGMPGPPVVLYLTAVRAGSVVTRATTLTFFAVSYGASLVLQSATVGVGREVWITGGLLVPVAAVGALVGHRLAGRVSETVFRRVVLTLVTSTGVYVLIDTLLR